MAPDAIRAALQSSILLWEFEVETAKEQKNHKWRIECQGHINALRALYSQYATPPSDRPAAAAYAAGRTGHRGPQHATT